MRILATNDDGIYAPGLWRLVEALREAGEVWVVAPDREQSGVGTSVTLHTPLRIKEITPPLPGIPSFAVEGTPGDSVVLALGHIIKGGVDLVVSGINEGANLGMDVFISGTVGGAFQGYFYGLPALAVSVASLEKVHFGPAARLALLLVQRVAGGELPKELLLNVNLPNVPLEELQGMEVTALARRSYTDVIQEGHDGKSKYYWIVRGKAQWDAQPGSDVLAIRQNRVSVTPLRGGPGNHRAADALKKILPEVFQELKRGGSPPARRRGRDKR